MKCLELKRWFSSRCGLEGQVRHLDSELHFYKMCHDAAEKKISHLQEQLQPLRTRISLCEVVLANLLAKDTDCIMGWDFYLEKLQEVRKTDPDSNPKQH